MKTPYKVVQELKKKLNNNLVLSIDEKHTLLTAFNEALREIETTPSERSLRLCETITEAANDNLKLATTIFGRGILDEAIEISNLSK